MPAFPGLQAGAGVCCTVHASLCSIIHPHTMPRRVRLEHQIESEYRGALQQQCYNERMLQVWLWEEQGQSVDFVAAVVAAERSCQHGRMAHSTALHMLVISGTPNGIPAAATLPLLRAARGGSPNGAQIL